jgi:hypothetical protein
VVRDQLAHASAAFDEGLFKEACNYYRAAFKRKPSREIACNLGVSARLSGDPMEAAQALTICLAEPLPPLGPNDDDEKKRRIRYRADLEVVLQQTGAIEIKTTPGAEVVIDNVPRGVAPLPAFFVSPDTHTIVVQDKRGQASRSVAVGAGRRVVVELVPGESAKDRSAASRAASAPEKSTGIRPLVIIGHVGAALAFSTSIATLTASRVVGDQASEDLATARKASPLGCATPKPGPACDDAGSAWSTAGTLQTVGIAGLVMAAVVGGGTVIYAVTTSPHHGPTVSATKTGATFGWEGTW